MARRNWFVAGILILAAWGMVSISFQGCSTTPAAPVTVTQGVTLIATPPPSTVAGRDWTYATLGAAFSNRYGHASVVYNNLMWVIGGFDGVYYVNDVWSSADGKTWTQMLANNASPGSGQFSQRIGSASVTFNNKMWVIGGSYGGGPFNDVWSSPDGVNWTNVLANNPSPGPNQFNERNFHTCVVYNNKLWVIGGFAGASPLNDVWSSSDGVSWTNVLADTASPGPNQFSKRGYFSSVVFGGSMWVMGGQTASNRLNDVWFSTDGVTWTNILTNNASPGANQFSQREEHSSLVYGNAMWVIGGASISGNLNDVWYSSNGYIWNQMTASAAFPARNSQTNLVFNNAMYLIGGEATGYFNDVWYSPF